MIEEKTKEPQSQAPAAPVKGREKLRSFWAKVQISGLLRRHRFRRKTQRHMNDVAKKLRASAVVLAVGETFYALGFAAEYMVVRTGRGIAAVARRLARWCRNALHTISATAFPGAAQMFKDLLAPLYLFFKGLGAVAAQRRAPGAGLWCFRKSGRALFCGRAQAQPEPAAPDSNVHPAPVYAGRVRHGLEQDDGPALCAGCAGERPDRWLCGQ